MLPRERLPFSPIEGRPPLQFPENGRLIVWPVLALEDWDISRPMARTVIPPPQGQVMLPDVPNLELARSWKTDPPSRQRLTDITPTPADRRTDSGDEQSVPTPQPPYD